MAAHKPVVGIPCDHRMVGKHPFHMVGEKYIAAVRDGSGATPLLIPVLANPIPPAELLASVDGFRSPVRFPMWHRSITAGLLRAMA